MCRKTSCQGKSLAWLSRELELELRGKKENISPLERWSRNLGGYKDVIRSCRKKIKRDKTQLELALAITVKDKKKASINMLTAKGGSGSVSTIC